MSSYNLYQGSSDFLQNDGTALVNTETKIDAGTVKMGGNVAANGPLDAINQVVTYDEQYGGSYVAGVNNAVGAASWQVSTTSGSVANGAGKYVGYMLVTDTAHGRAVDDVIRLSDGGNVYTGVYRIMAVVNANTYVVNGKYVSNVGSVTISHGQAISATNAAIKAVGDVTAGRYSVRVIGLSLYNGATINVLASPASEYGRRKLHSRTAVRTKLVEASIRAGDWDIYTGTFANPVATQNDFSAFKADGEIADNTLAGSISVGGEFAFRIGITVTKDQYEH